MSVVVITSCIIVYLQLKAVCKTFSLQCILAARQPTLSYNDIQPTTVMDMAGLTRDRISPKPGETWNIVCVLNLQLIDYVIA